jgi:hypothetical protein
MRKLFFTLSLFLISISSFSQTTGIGQWREHLPYYQCIAVKEVGSRIYCATPYSIFYFDKDDNSIQRISKINGLSDIGISSMNYNAAYNTLVIAYTNANIDLIKGNTIINMPDIKRSSILGNKTINDIYFVGQYAYLSCGFGIVVLDLAKEEVHDTYYIGAQGGQVNVLGLTKDDQDTIYAATDHGLYIAYAKNPDLANYQSWTKDTRLNTSATYDHIITFNGQVIISKYQSVTKGDSLYRHNNGQWTKWLLGTSNTVKHFESTYGKLLISFNYFVKYYDQDFTYINGIYNYNGGLATPSDAIFDKEGIIWIADANSGLVSLATNGNFNPINISGPLSSLVFSITTYGNDVYVVPGGRDLTYVPNYYGAAIYHYDGTSWNNITSATDTGLNKITDLSTISVDPSDSKRVYAGSFFRGLIELYDGKVVGHFGVGNSTLKNHSADPDTSDVRVGGTGFDSDGNLWVVNSHNNTCISRYCRTCAASDQWIGYTLPIIQEDDLGQMIVDSYNQKWVVTRINGSITSPLLVFKEDSKNPTNSSSILLSQQTGNGNIPGQYVYALACDKNGEVWVGTEKGIGVFFNPENIFTGQNFDAQQILVQQGLYVQYLMENEKVTAIAVDGANRKWIGTEGGGLYLFSADGTKQIYHFTTDNSPLFSNTILAIAIDPETGEVFIGTDEGLISYKGTATEGGDSFSNVYAYPNPVRENYEGEIGIKGLVSNAQVRITDIAGNLIFSTQANGGLAIWDGKNFDGSRAKSGVYLVYAGNSTGSQKIVTKILIIH